MKRFSVPFENTKLIGDLLGTKEDKKKVLFLHGAGQSNRARWQLLREELLQHGIGSYAFDFIGHGDTGGDISSSSLARRTDQALQFIKTLNIPLPLIIIGSSMGTYTALKISEKISTQNLIFLVPAIYDESAYAITFGTQFTEAIRKSMSWNNSDAWKILENFKGRLLIIGAEKDETVPRELTQKIYDSAPHAEREVYFVPESSHSLGQFMKHNPVEKGKIISLIVKFCV